MPRRLQYSVAVQNADDNTVWFGPDDDVPAWAAKLITNRSAWAPGDEDADAQEDPEGGDTLPEDAPPLAGKGSGKTEWASYATDRGITVPEGASRDDIVALVRSQAAGDGS